MNRLLLLFSAFLFSASLCSQNQCPVWDWAKRAPSGNRCHIEALPSGDYMIAGPLNYTIYFGTTTTTKRAGRSDSFIGRMDANGTGIWAKRIDDIAIDRAVLTPSNGLCVTGVLRDTVVLGTDTLIPCGIGSGIGYCTKVIVQFDNAGNVQWARSVDNASFYDLDIDANGNVIICGSTSPTYFGPFFTGNFSSTGRSYIVKIDTQGNWKWLNVLSSTSGVSDIETTTQGSIYASLNVTSNTSLGTLPTLSPGTYLSLLDSNGTWTQAFNSASTQLGYRMVAEDNLGNVILLSVADSTLYKYNQAGQQLWSLYITAKPYSTSFYGYQDYIDTDQNGGIYLQLRSFNESKVFVGQDSIEIKKTLHNGNYTNSPEIVLVKVSSTGQLMWAGSIGTWGKNYTNGLSNYSYATGLDISVISEDTILVSGLVYPDAQIGLDSIIRTYPHYAPFIARLSVAPTIAYYSYSDTIHCGDSLRLTVPTNSVAELYHTWSPATDMTDSTSSYPIVYPKSTTTYYVQAFNSNGCGDSAQVTVYVDPYINGPGLTNFVPSTGNFYYCDNGYSVNIPTPGLTNFQWSNGDTSSTLYPNQPGVYSCTYENLNGCLVSDSFNIFPIAEVQSIAQHNLLCLGDTQTLYNFLPVDSVRWNTGSAKDSIAVTSPGTYWMEAWKDGCHYTDSMEIYQFTDTANAEFTSQIQGDTVTFIPASIGIAKAQWYFGDGWNDNVISPTHVYARKDTFEVCLEILDVCGYRDTVCKMVNLNTIGLLEHQAAEAGFSLYPNPVENILHILYPPHLPTSSTGITGTITDISGRQLVNFQIKKAGELSIDLSSLSPGVYTVQIGSTRKQLVKR